MTNLASHRTFFPGKIFHSTGKLSRHRSAEKKGAKEATKPIKEKRKKELTRARRMTVLIIGSTDVVALYPSLDIIFTIDKVCEVFFESDISIQGIDYAELGLYLAVTTSPEVLTKLGIADVYPTRKTNKGRPPTITASGSEEQKEKRFN